MSAPNSGIFPIPTLDLPPLSQQSDRLDERGNGYGECISCTKYKRLWSRLCAWCGEACA